MGGNEVGDAGLQALRQMPGLTHLDLSGRQGTDSNVWAIAMSDSGLDAVLSLKELRDLRFGCTFVGVGVEGSRFATVSAMSVNTRWLEKMKSLKKLERLQTAGLQPGRRRVTGGAGVISRIERVGPQRHFRDREGSRDVSRRQAQNRNLHRPLGREGRRVSKQLSRCLWRCGGWCCRLRPCCRTPLAANPARRTCIPRVAAPSKSRCPPARIRRRFERASHQQHWGKLALYRNPGKGHTRELDRCVPVEPREGRRKGAAMRQPLEGMSKVDCESIQLGELELIAAQKQ